MQLSHQSKCNVIMYSPPALSKYQVSDLAQYSLELWDLGIDTFCDHTLREDNPNPNRLHKYHQNSIFFKDNLEAKSLREMKRKSRRKEHFY